MDRCILAIRFDNETVTEAEQMILNRRQFAGGLAAASLLPALPAHAETAETIDARVNLALRKLWESPGTRGLADRARGVLVMPNVVKGGFVIGGAYGEGALRLPETQYSQTAGYYSVAAALLGLQIGVQRTAHALFFLTDKALRQFQVADGWEIGADAEVTLADNGFNAQINTTEFDKPVVAVVFDEDGLMIGASLEGAKYSPVRR